MLLLGLLLLTSALAGQRTGTRAESNLSSKLQLSSDKEQNGESLLPRFPRLSVRSGWHCAMACRVLQPRS